MEHLITPAGYKPVLDLRETQVAIKEIKDFFQRELAKQLNLTRVSAPLFVDPSSGLNDNLNGVERPVTFDIKESPDQKAEIVHSLAKWKRYALKKYGFAHGEGLYTDIAALALDHSVQTLKLDDSTIDYTAMYEKLANRINKDFRAYREKGKPQTKIEQLTEQIKCAFKIGETDTCKSVAKRFYEIAQTAVSIEASMTLEMQQAQSEIIAETAVMTMGG